MKFLDNIIDWLLPSLPPKVPSPVVVKPKQDLALDVKPDNVRQDVTWGNSRVVDAIVTQDKDVNAYDWELYDKGGKLSAVPLSSFDEDEIRQGDLNREIYRKAKPYVLAPEKYTNKAIAIVLGVSKSSIDKVSGKIKAARQLELEHSPIG